MTFAQLNRRTHLYLGLALLPWFFMYGISSLPFAHTQFFDQRDAAKGLPLWTLRSDRITDVRPPAGDNELRAFGAALLSEAGISGTAFGTYQQNANQINVYSYSFWKSTQLKYFLDTRRLTVEDRRFRWDHFLTGMHARGGFEQEGFLDDAWGVLVDITSLGMLLWVFTGFYMWWSLPALRKWGWLAFLGGAASFALFMAKL